MKKIFSSILIVITILIIVVLIYHRTQVNNEHTEQENNTTPIIEEKVLENNNALTEIENKVEQNNTLSDNIKKKTEKKTTSSTKEKKQKSVSSTKEKNNSTKTKSEKKEAIFTNSKIPEKILQKMIGNSIPEKSKNKVNIDNLSYLKITYWGFDQKTHVGEMIVNKKVAQEVLSIFKEVYQKKYPIEKIKLIDEYGANDEKSMRDNNTSAFCYRVVANTNTLSNHSKGTAIDINPLYNPYIVGSYVSPSTAKKYTDRGLNKKGMIKKGDDLYNAFVKRGWTWGGSWKSKKDYQHFEKAI